MPQLLWMNKTGDSFLIVYKSHEINKTNDGCVCEQVLCVSAEPDILSSVT